MSQYDRSIFRAVATAKGDADYNDTAARLMVAPATAWRLWKGKTAPSAQLAAKVQTAYGIGTADLLRTTESAA